MSFWKMKEIPLGIVVVTGLLMLAEYYLNIPALSAMADELKSWVVILGALAMIIGGFSLLRKHVNRIIRRDRDWIYSVMTLVLLVSMSVTGLLYGANSYSWKWFFDNWYMAARQAMYASGTFYMYSTFYRAFRIRNWDSAVIVVAAALILMGIAPIYGLLWEGFLPIKDWLSDVGQLGATRGMNISVTIGMLLLALRVILGMETSAIGLIPGSEEE
jgi:hypothetical protein